MFLGQLTLIWYLWYIWYWVFQYFAKDGVCVFVRHAGLHCSFLVIFSLVLILISMSLIQWAVRFFLLLCLPEMFVRVWYYLLPKYFFKIMSTGTRIFLLEKLTLFYLLVVSIFIFWSQLWNNFFLSRNCQFHLSCLFCWSNIIHNILL